MSTVSTNINIRCYSTWKKNNNPDIYRVQDGIKGWAIQTVGPTIEHYGWKQCVFDYDYNLCCEIKPKQKALELLHQIWGEEWLKGKKFVYYLYIGTNGYMDCIYVWYKDENEPDLDLEYWNKKYEN